MHNKKQEVLCKNISNPWNQSRNTRNIRTVMGACVLCVFLSWGTQWLRTVSILLNCSDTCRWCWVNIRVTWFYSWERTEEGLQSMVLAKALLKIHLERPKTDCLADTYKPTPSPGEITWSSLWRFAPWLPTIPCVPQTHKHMGSVWHTACGLASRVQASVCMEEYSQDQWKYSV